MQPQLPRTALTAKLGGSLAKKGVPRCVDLARETLTRFMRLAALPSAAGACHLWSLLAARRRLASMIVSAPKARTCHQAPSRSAQSAACAPWVDSARKGLKIFLKFWRKLVTGDPTRTRLISGSAPSASSTKHWGRIGGVTGPHAMAGSIPRARRFSRGAKVLSGQKAVQVAQH